MKQKNKKLWISWHIIGYIDASLLRNLSTVTGMKWSDIHRREVIRIGGGAMSMNQGVVTIGTGQNF